MTTCYLDANVLVYFVDTDGLFHLESVELVESFGSKGIKPIISDGINRYPRQVGAMSSFITATASVIISSVTTSSRTLIGLGRVPSKGSSISL